VSRSGVLVQSGLLGGLLVLSSWWFAEIFASRSDGLSLVAVVVVVSVAVGALRLKGPPPLLRDVVVGLVALVLAIGLISILSADQPVSEARAGLVDGWARLLTTQVPAPDRLDLLIAPLIIVGIATVVAQLLLFRTRSVWLPSLPVLFVACAGLAMGTADVRQPVVLALGLTAGLALLGLLRASLPVAERSLDERLQGDEVLVAPALTGVVLLLIAVGIGSSVAWSVLGSVDGESFTLRRYVSADLDDLRLSSPLTRVQELSTEDEVLRIEAITSIPAGTRVRLAGLNSFDGLGWASDDVMQPVGSNIPGSGLPGTTLELTITPQRLEMPWIPSIGRATTVENETAGEATLVLWSDQSSNLATADMGDSDGVSWRVSGVVPAPSQEQLVAARLAPSSPLLLHGRAENVEVGKIGDLAEEIVGADPSSFAAAARLLAFFRNDESVNTGAAFSVDAMASPNFTLGGVSNFLDQRVGDRLQFAAAYAAMARLAGLPIRLAVGVQVAAGLQPGVPLSVPGEALTAWPEVNVAGVGWIALDPDPDAEGEAMSPAEQEVEEALASAGSIPADEEPPPPENAEVNPDSQESVQSDVPVGKLLALLLVAGLLTVLAAPVLRARRRAGRRTGSPEHRITGAWAELLDVFAEQGESRPLASTPQEVCDRLSSFLSHEGSEAAQELACLLEVAVFSSDEPTDADADRAWQMFARVRAGLDRTRWERLRASLSIGPLRSTIIRSNVGWQEGSNA
jgi:transglutaminase-like putative cysteine protease